jgi:hypothetical protein
MWSWSLNWNEVTASILVGSCPRTAADLAQLAQRAGVSAILSLQHDDCLAYWGIDYADLRAAGERLDLRMARSPMRDFDLDDQRRNLPAAVAALAALQARGHRTYVHCTAGLGRGPLTLLGYLTWIEGRSLIEALDLIHWSRPGAVPALEAYHGCHAELVAQQRPQIERRAHALYQSRDPQAGNAETDWLRAEAEVVREALSPSAARWRVA